MTATTITRSRSRLSSRQKTWIAFGVIAVALVIPLRGLLRVQGSPMEEGFMLVFPERVLHGDLPNRDFLHLYGPGSLWLLAGWLKVWGVSLTAERIYGLGQIIGIILGIYGLARYWGRTAALPCALLSMAFILPPLGLTALAWVGGVALGLLGLLAVLDGRRRLPTDERAALRFALVGGLVWGAALLFRLDLVVAVGLGGLAASWGLTAAFRKRLLLGLALGLSPYVIQLATAGPVPRLQGDDPRPGHLPARRTTAPDPAAVGPPRRVPAARGRERSHRAGRSRRSPRRSSSRSGSSSSCSRCSRSCSSVVGPCAAIVHASRRACCSPSACSRSDSFRKAVQRVDSAHFGWVSCVAGAFLPIAFIEIFRVRKPDVDACGDGT